MGHDLQLPDPPQPQDPTALRQRLQNDFLASVNNGTVALWVQPKRSLRNGQDAGVEGLVRAADGGQTLGAAEVLAAASQAPGGLDHLLCVTTERLLAQFRSLPRLSVAVNVTPMQFANLPLMAQLLDRAENLAMAHRLIVEITEDGEWDSDELALDSARLLKSGGVRIELDDFGAGTSGLRRLRQGWFDGIKLDGMFAQSYCHNPTVQTIVHSLIGLGLDLGMPTTVEHVGSRFLAKRLAGAGASYGQGYWDDGEPVPVPTYLQRHGQG
jgi:EAL domain-containing protein (putative c-di-GMP-specific phosphodiesterase class I)